MTSPQRMTTPPSPPTPIRRFGASLLLAGTALTLAIAVTASPAAQAAPDAKPAKAAPVDAKAVYEAKCQVCHMADGNSQIMPNMSFADGVWKHGATLKAVQTTITNGVPGTAMLPFKDKLSAAEIRALAAYVRAFDPKLAPKKK